MDPKCQNKGGVRIGEFLCFGSDLTQKKQSTIIQSIFACLL